MPTAIKNVNGDSFITNTAKVSKRLSLNADVLDRVSKLVDRSAPVLKLSNVDISAFDKFFAAFSAVPVVTGLFKLPSVIAYFFLGDHKVNTTARNIFMAIRLPVESLGLVSSLSKLGIINTKNISAIAGKVPFIGAKLAMFSIGPAIQPLLMGLSVSSLSDVIPRMRKLTPVKNRISLKIEQWKSKEFDPKNHFADRKDSKGQDAAYVEKKIDQYNGLDDAAKGVVKVRKIAKWEAKLANVNADIKKSWISIATDVSKLICSIATFSLLVGATLAGLPAFVVSVAFVAAAFDATKAVYGLYHEASRRQFSAVKLAA